MRAAIFEQLGKWEEACHDYRKVLEKFPNHRSSRVKLAQALMIRQRYDEAEAEFRIQLAVDPDDSDARLGLAQCARRGGRSGEAKEHLQAALALTLPPSRRGEALRELGRIRLDAGEVEQAVVLLKQAAALAPGDAQVHHALGTALARQGKAEEAQAALRPHAASPRTVRPRHRDHTPTDQ